MKVAFDILRKQTNLLSKATSWFAQRISWTPGLQELTWPIRTGSGQAELWHTSFGGHFLKVRGKRIHISHINSLFIQHFPPRFEKPNKEGDGLHHQLLPLHHLHPGRSGEPQLRDHLPRHMYIPYTPYNLSPRHHVRKWTWHERGQPGNVLELCLLWARFDCGGAWVDAHLGICARTQSETGVSNVLLDPPWILVTKLPRMPGQKKG